jgi:hypothetical protein
MTEFLNQVLFFIALFVLVAVYMEFREVVRLLRDIRDAAASAAYYTYLLARGGQQQADSQQQEDDGVQQADLTAEELCVIEHLRAVGCDTFDNIKQKCPGASYRILTRVASRRRGGMYCLKGSLRERL